jgi:hypothetical protein
MANDSEGEVNRHELEGTGKARHSDGPFCFIIRRGDEIYFFAQLASNSALVMRIEESQPFLHCSTVGFMPAASLPVFVPPGPALVPPPPEPPEPWAKAAPVAITSANAAAVRGRQAIPFTEREWRCQSGLLQVRPDVTERHAFASCLRAGSQELHNRRYQKRDARCDGEDITFVTELISVGMNEGSPH